jgi:hypothetical protein
VSTRADADGQTPLGEAACHGRFSASCPGVPNRAYMVIGFAEMGQKDQPAQRLPFEQGLDWFRRSSLPAGFLDELQPASTISS